MALEMRCERRTRPWPKPDREAGSRDLRAHGAAVAAGTPIAWQSTNYRGDSHGQRHRSEVSVITGASSGIGLELAKQCAANRFDVRVCAEDTGIQSIAATIDAHAVAVPADLSTREGVEQLAQSNLEARLRRPPT